MKAMLFAAGRGTRLRPLTDHLPKCLVTVNEVSLLEHNIRHLKSNGVTTIVINVHYLKQQIMDFIQAHDFGVEINFSIEDELLETGGGLLKAEAYFKNDDAFLVCNSDIYTDLDLRAMTFSHLEQGNLATLAVADRLTSRYLRFEKGNQLCGWENKKTGDKIIWGEKDYQRLAFNGVQVLSPKIFDYMRDQGRIFSTIPIYLKAAQAGERVAAYPMDNSYWIDIGTLDKLEELRKHFART